MPKVGHTPSPQIAHVSITLDEVVPEVSRIVAMPLGIRLDMLHLIIQAAMGWTNSHLWLIHARGSTWGVPDPDYPDDTIPANRTLLLDMIADIGTNRFEYIYDFGDHWSHTIKIVRPLPAVPGINYSMLSAAARRRTAAAPRLHGNARSPSRLLKKSKATVVWTLEITALIELKSARRAHLRSDRPETTSQRVPRTYFNSLLGDPAHPRHAEVIEWLGPDFDPNDANRTKLETDVAALAKLMTPRRRASAKPKPKERRPKRSNDELL